MATHIAFLTLFLSLVNGRHPVALTASPGVARIELLLDGRSAGTMSGPPWAATIDLGRSLLPHRLEARGLAADGGELARAEQWVNLPRPQAEVEILVEGEPGKPGRARLVSASRTGELPVETRLSLDGKPLRLDGQGRATVPAVAAGKAHVLSAMLRFRNGFEARRDRVLTGDWGSDVATELTAVAVRTEKPGQALAGKDLQDLFTAGGQPLQVSAVDREEAEVFVVRARGVEREVGKKIEGGLVGLSMHMTMTNELAVYGAFPSDFRCNLVAAAPTLHETAGLTATAFDLMLGGPQPSRYFASYLLAPRMPGERSGGTRLADATAIAGLQAYSRQKPRAVLLILQGNADDGSAFEPAAVRAYLAALGVPLFVWSVDGSGLANPAWGPIEDVQGVVGLRTAYRRLFEELRRQQIVWLQGRHLPQEIALSARAAAQGLEPIATPAALRPASRGAGMHRPPAMRVLAAAPGQAARRAGLAA